MKKQKLLIAIVLSASFVVLGGWNWFKGDGSEITTAQIIPEEMIVPDCEYPLPPYYFSGKGIAIIYEIPFSRVKDIIPEFFTPDPEKKKIWFMINYYNWEKFYPVDDPDSLHSFNELYYKFSVKHGSQLGDYPIKLYLDSDMGIASGIELYGYPKYHAQMTFTLAGKRGSFLVQRNGITELKIEIRESKGFIAGVMSFFANMTANSYINRYSGNFLYDRVQDRLVKGTTEIRNVNYKLAKIKRIYLREPLEWEILTEEEMLNPKYVFILEDTEAVLEQPEEITIQR